MAGNSIGKQLVLTTFGESHGVAVGGVLDGFPPNIHIDLDFIQSELDRRRPGKEPASSTRKEEDRIVILSGIFEGKSTGTPIAFLVYNKDARTEDYSHLKDFFRPSHADYTYQKKYGIRDYRGGGRASARETVARVCGGAFAKLFLQEKGINLTAQVVQIGRFRIPDEQDAADRYLKELKEQGDTTGGIIACTISGVPAGLGEPVFDKLQADLAKAMLSINAVKGFEYGSGFHGASMKGSEHNDLFIPGKKEIGFQTNHSGGILGGISTGQEIFFRVAFKPVSTLMMDQQMMDRSGKTKTVPGKGRHDVCVVPRAIPIVESMAALVIADHLIRFTPAEH